MSFLQDAFYLILVLGILVLIHEFGHFMAARLTGTRSDVFSVGMGFRILGYNKITGFTFGSLPKDWAGNGCTDYRLSLFPIGGYVKIAGMVDETMDTDFVSKEPQSWEFRSKNTLQKAFMLSGGVLMNALLAIVIFSGIFFYKGTSLIKNTTISYVQKGSISERIGLRENDIIMEVNGKHVNTWDEYRELLAIREMGETRVIKVLRNGQEVIIRADGTEVLKAISNEVQSNFMVLGVNPDYVFVNILGVETLKPAGKAGIKSGDTIISINNEPINSTIEFSSIVKNSKNTRLEFKWKRGNQFFKDSIAPTSEGQIGVQITESYSGPVLQKSFNIFQSVYSGTDEFYKTVKIIVGSFEQMIKGNLSFKKNIAGPIQIAKHATQQADLGLVPFLNFMALLSISLAVINILPFPALDGGHLIFTLIEGITRREIPVKVKLVVQQAGLVVLLLLMVFVVYNDLTKL